MRQTRGIAATALGVLLALTVGAPSRVQAYCPTECQGPNPTWNDTQNGCTVAKFLGCTGASASAPKYGAIAYGRTSGAWGSFYSWGNQKKAESVAMKHCAKHGDDCEILVWFDRKCGAVAAPEDATAFWGLGDSEDQARADAQSKCVKDGGKDCEVQASQCSK